MEAEKRIKKVNEYKILVEVAEFNKLAIYVGETIDLLETLECKSIEEFELKINKKTGFVNTLMSATAYGKDTEYKRLLELQKLIDGKLSAEDLTASKQLKSTTLNEIKERHTEYYTDRDVEVKTIIDDIIKLHKTLSSKEKENMGLNRAGELVFSPFSEFVRYNG